MSSVKRKVSMALDSGSAELFSYHQLSDSGEHLGIAFGNWSNQPSPLVRIHSECLTGDVFGSSRCDCGNQLQEAIQLMQKEGGIILYLRQEGRGIGLYNKLEAYHLQSQGCDTYQANELLGFKPDLRNYEVAAQMLKAMGKTSIHLLSNNPDKKQQLIFNGIDVVAMHPTGVYLKSENKNYLQAKITKTSHQLSLPQLNQE